MNYSCFLLFLLQVTQSTASQCEDDKSMDCERLDRMFDICDDIHDAKQICRKFCNLCLLVDGNWADWSEWSACDVTCGDGKISRVRKCSNPAPAHQGLECKGENIDRKSCKRPLCPVHGGWSRWSSWNACPVTCGIGLQKRQRMCSNPYPLRYGDHCFGDALEHKICFKQLCDGGVWANWESWGTCRPSCDSGVHQRSRSCVNQIGTKCKGESHEVKLCSKHDCLQTCSSKSAYISMFYTNVASGKNVRLSSIHNSFPGRNMVDGNYDSFAHTNNERNPYALVDLSNVYRIFHIHIINRKDCCAYRLHNVVIQVGFEASSLLTVARHDTAIGATCTFSLKTPVSGRYVKIMLEATEFLNISELQVFGKR